MTPKICYCYDSKGYYICQDSDYGQGLPNNAKYIQPEIIPGFIPRWPVENKFADDWEQVENHKGENGYVNGKMYMIKDYGPYPDGWSATPPTPTLDEAKTLKKSDIDYNTNRIRERDGLLFADLHFAMTDGAMTKWTGLLAAKDMLPFPVTILSMNDEPLQLTDQGMLMQFAGAALSYETAAESPVSTGRALRQAVEACTNFEELDLVVDNRE